jgi:hypothetical protein
VKKFWNCIEFASTYSQMTGNDVAVFFQSLFTIIASVGFSYKLQSGCIFQSSNSPLLFYR